MDKRPPRKKKKVDLSLHRAVKLLESSLKEPRDYEILLKRAKRALHDKALRKRLENRPLKVTNWESFEDVLMFGIAGMESTRHLSESLTLTLDLLDALTTTIEKEVFPKLPTKVGLRTNLAAARRTVSSLKKRAKGSLKRQEKYLKLLEIEATKRGVYT